MQRSGKLRSAERNVALDLFRVNSCVNRTKTIGIMGKYFKNVFPKSHSIFIGNVASDHQTATYIFTMFCAQHNTNMK